MQWLLLCGNSGNKNRFCFACISAILNLKQICPKMDFCQQQEYLPNAHKTDKLYLHIQLNNNGI